MPDTMRTYQTEVVVVVVEATQPDPESRRPPCISLATTPGSIIALPRRRSQRFLKASMTTTYCYDSYNCPFASSTRRGDRIACLGDEAARGCWTTHRKQTRTGCLIRHIHLHGRSMAHEQVSSEDAERTRDFHCPNCLVGYSVEPAVLCAVWYY